MTGLSFIRLDPESTKFDTGNILFQEQIKVKDTEKYSELKTKLSDFCSLKLNNFLENDEYFISKIGIKQDNFSFKPSGAPKFKVKVSFLLFLLVYILGFFYKLV